jgi:prepilin-type N-terminal cleavage/methylation domain-containing protein
MAPSLAVRSLLQTDDMRRNGGFTLLEVMITVAIIGIIAAGAYAYMRSASRNADLSAAASELSLLMSGLSSVALSEGRDQVLVFTDAAGNDASECRWTNLSACSRYFHLDDVDATWTLASFDAANPSHNADLVNAWTMPRGVRLDLSSTAAPPAPFSNIAPLDSDYTATCAGNRRCFAIRFTSAGDARPEPASTPPTLDPPGYAAVLVGAMGRSGGGDRRAVLVTSPSGIVKSFSVGE